MEESISTKNSINKQFYKKNISHDFAQIQQWDESMLSNNLDMKS